MLGNGLTGWPWRLVFTLTLLVGLAVLSLPQRDVLAEPAVLVADLAATNAVAAEQGQSVTSQTALFTAMASKAMAVFSRLQLAASKLDLFLYRNSPH